MNIGILAAVLLISGFSASAYAQRSDSNTFRERPTFNYAEVGYGRQKLDVFSPESVNDGRSCWQDGAFLNASIMVNEQVFVEARHSDLEGSLCGFRSTSIGTGLRVDFGRTSVLYGAVRLIYRKYRPAAGGDSDPGVGLTAGIRTMLAPGVEMNGFFGAEKVDEIGETFAGLGVNYYLTREFSLTGDLTLNDDGNEAYSVGVRINF